MIPATPRLSTVDPPIAARAVCDARREGETTADGQVRIDRFNGLFARHYAAIYRYLFRMTAGDRALSEDLCQESFLRAYRSIADLRSNDTERPWIYRIATTQFLNHVRRHRPSVGLEESVIDHRAVVGSDVDDLLQRVRVFVAGLPPRQRAALILRHLDGREYDEVAAAIGCSVVAARASVSEAVWRIRAEFGEEYVTL